jgi:hypothetical protein
LPVENDQFVVGILHLSIINLGEIHNGPGKEVDPRKY